MNIPLDCLLIGKWSLTAGITGCLSVRSNPRFLSIFLIFSCLTTLGSLVLTIKPLSGDLVLLFSYVAD